MKLDDRQIALVARSAGVAIFAWVLLRTAWVSDDAYISFRVVENAVDGLGLRWNVADRVQVSTHPLWLLLHIPLRTITGEIYFTSLALCGTISLATLGLLLWRVAESAQAALLVAALAVSSRAFVDYSTSGLENPLTHLLAVAFFFIASREEQQDRDLLLLASLAGLLAWNRLDTVAIALPVLGLTVYRRTLRDSWKPLLAGFAPLGVWFVFATVYFGHPLPNTAFAKLGAGTPLGELIGSGVRYLAYTMRDDPLTIGTIVAALVVAVLRRRHLGIAAGILLYLLYVLRIGGDFMGGRFLTLPFVLALAILAVEAARLRGRTVAIVAAIVVVAGLAVDGAPLTSGPGYGRPHAELIDADGIADERAYYFRMSGLWNLTETTLPRDDKWFEATTARECGFPLVIAGAIGFYGYAAGPDVHILDYNALADPVLARLPAVENDELYLDWYRGLTGEDPARQRRVGHFLRNIPPGYVSYLLGDATAFEDESLAHFVESVTLAARGPLLSGARLGAANEIAFGGRPEGLDGPEYRRFAPMPVEEILLSGADGTYTSTLQGCALSHADPQNAIVLLQQAVEGCDRNGLAWKCLAEAVALVDRPDLSIQAWRRVIDIAPESDWAHAGYGRARLVVGDAAGAVESYERATELNARNAAWWNGLADAREAGGDQLGAGDARARAERLSH